MNVQERVKGDNGDPGDQGYEPDEKRNESSCVQPATRFQIGGEVMNYLSVALLTGAFLFLIGLFAGRSSVGPPTFVETSSMSQCTSDRLSQIGTKQPVTPDMLREVAGFCYSVARSEGLLRNFAILNLGFIQQYRSNEILLWMVVIITLSGVALAGIQVNAAYRLAEKNNQVPATNDEITLQRDRIVLKSSITGIFILILSFAFFLVFVLYVYRFEQPKDEDAVTPQTQVTLPSGGLGDPPSGAPQENALAKPVVTPPQKKSR